MTTENTALSYQQLWALVVDNVFQQLIVKDEENDDYVDPIILATSLYANLYLENNMHGDKNKQGRFYWAAYSVFTHLNLLRYVMTFSHDTLSVARDEKKFNEIFDLTGLSKEEISAKFACEDVMNDVHRYVIEDIRKYTLWLALDMLSNHYYFQMDEDSLILKNAKKIIFENPDEAAIHYHLADVNWFMEVKDALIHASEMPSLYRAFDLIKNNHNVNIINDSDALFSHLLAMTEHIQQHLAQPLIYRQQDTLSQIATINQKMRVMTEDKEFALAPCNDTAIDINTCYPFKNEEIRNPNRIQLSDSDRVNSYAYRMQNIKEEAEKFHYLMQACPDLMQEQITKIASWLSFDHQNNQ